MRLRVSHETTYTYEPRARGLIQIARLTPRSHDGQHVIRWRTEVSADCQLAAYRDAFGNIAHCFTIDGPIEKLHVAVYGEVETHERNGLVSGGLEHFPPELFLRDTPLTQASAEIARFARAIGGVHGGSELAAMHELQAALHREFTFQGGTTDATTSAEDAFRQKRGVCQDYTHVFLAAARHIGVPARYVSGHLFRGDTAGAQQAGHAWAEAYIPNLGWVGFDPTNGVCVTEAYVRVAIGLDYLGAAPIRGTITGYARETLAVSVRVEQAATQCQS
jgi:transglutaminase-like putative cysteine protease